MWPFKKKNPPPDVVNGSDRATYNQRDQEWQFTVDGIEFTLTDRDFDISLFQSARDILETIRQLEYDIRSKVDEILEGWPCDHTKQRILCINLDDYASSGSADIAFIGDDSWGDYGVNIILQEGKIIDAYGGD